MPQEGKIELKERIENEKEGKKERKTDRVFYFLRARVQK